MEQQLEIPLEVFTRGHVDGHSKDLTALRKVKKTVIKARYGFIVLNKSLKISTHSSGRYKIGLVD